jgi:hypothetical protein
MLDMPLHQVLNTIQPYIIGAVFGFIGSFAAGFKTEIFNERARKARHKLDVAIQVHKICNEASTGNFRTAPRDMEHVNSVLTDLDGVDKKMGKTMNSFINSWQLLVEFYQEGGSHHEEREFFNDLLKDAEENRKTLVGWANKIRAGN